MLVGPQGSGKGTQAVLLSQTLGIPHISTGDLFRAAAVRKTDVGLTITSIMQAGGPVPDLLTNQLVVERLDAPDARVGFILDGFPRNVEQARWLDARLMQDGEQVKHVVELTAPVELLRTRMLARGRPDDTPAAIDRRLQGFESLTRPVIDHYRDRVTTIDTSSPVEHVFKAVLGRIGKA